MDPIRLRGATSSADEAPHRFDVRAAGEDGFSQRFLLDAQMIPEQALQHGAQIGGRLEIAVLEQLRRLQSRPVRDHTTARERAADEEGDCAGAVVGALRAVDARRAAELRDDGDDRLAPGFTHVAFDGGKGAVERTEQIVELARGSTFGDVRVPADKTHGADARAVRLGKIARRGAGGFNVGSSDIGSPVPGEPPSEASFMRAWSTLASFGSVCW